MLSEAKNEPQSMQKNYSQSGVHDTSMKEALGNKALDILIQSPTCENVAKGSGAGWDPVVTN